MKIASAAFNPVHAVVETVSHAGDLGAAFRTMKLKKAMEMQLAAHKGEPRHIAATAEAAPKPSPVPSAHGEGGVAGLTGRPGARGVGVLPAAGTRGGGRRSGQGGRTPLPLRSVNAIAASIFERLCRLPALPRRAPGSVVRRSVEHLAEALTSALLDRRMDRPT